MTDLTDLWRFDLTVGNSKRPSEGACVLDAVSWFQYGRLGDHPPCVCPVIAAYVRVLNDYLSDEDRQRLKAYIPRLAGSVDRASEAARADFLAWQTIKVFLPVALRQVKMDAHADALAKAVSFRGAARECVEAQATARYLVNQEASPREARSAPNRLTEALQELMHVWSIEVRIGSLWRAIDEALNHTLAAATARKPEKRAECAMSAGGALIDTHYTMMVTWPVSDAAFVALDGTLAIGRQANAPDVPKFQNAVEQFARARCSV